MNTYENRLLSAIPTRTLTIKGYEIFLLPTEIMGDFFGYAIQGKAFIRDNLPKSAEKFVIHHELYHLKDKRHWLGWIGSEMRANVAAGYREPLGFLTTIKLSLNKRRMAKYWELLTHPSST